MLVAAGLITAEQLARAQEEAARSGFSLARALARTGAGKEEDILEAISNHYHIARYSPDRFPVDMALADAIPFDFARDRHMVPLERNARLLRVAVVDPSDVESLDRVQSQTRLEVEPVLCSESDFNQLMRSVYGASPDLSQLLTGAEAMQITAEDEEEEHEAEIQLTSLRDMAKEAPVVRMLNWILAEAVRDGASDIHLSPEKNTSQIRFRIDGRLVEKPSPPKKLHAPLVSRVKILAGMDIATTRIPQDGRFTVRVDQREINVRASVVPTTNGENVVMRLLDMSSMTYRLDALGIDERDRLVVEELIQKPYGMLLVTGPTGSGKSTTLYAVLQKLNRPDVNIITLEDPVEYRMPGIRQLQLNVRAGMTFASGLRAVLRQDPDVIMVGEIRDAETASIAVRAAMTGHMVLSTVHTNDAAGAITRLADMGVEPFLVASVLLVCIAQRLVRTVCSQCKEPYQPPARALAQWGLADTAGATFMRGAGCPRCNATGYRGRTGIYEVLVLDDVIREMAIQRKPAHEIRDAAVAAGKLTLLRDDALRKAMQGITTLEEAAAAVMV